MKSAGSRVSRIEYRSDGHPGRVAEIAAEFVRQNVDALVTTASITHRRGTLRHYERPVSRPQGETPLWERSGRSDVPVVLRQWTNLVGPLSRLLGGPFFAERLAVPLDQSSSAERLPEHYRALERECIEWANKAQTDRERQIFVQMAKAWSTVAELAEKIRPIEEALGAFFDPAHSSSESSPNSTLQ